MSETVEIVVPWRDTSNELRRVAFDRVLQHLENAADYLAWPAKVTVLNTAGDVFSAARSRNHGARQSSADVVVFNDADSICSFRAIAQAVEWALDEPGLVFAYDLYCRTNSEGKTVQEIFNSGSMGCVAIQRSEFIRVGGFDESFEGWGYEDLEFANRCATLHPLRRVSAPLFHLWHGERRPDDSPDDSDPVLVERNLARWAALRNLARNLA